jgi:rSAM/selenodomain-associated transferase 2
LVAERREEVKLSIIVPVLDEAAGIAATLGGLAPLRAAGHEVIVVDGGSVDATAAIAAQYADRVIQAQRGRARQMNAGAAIAAGDALLFLHADTRLPGRAAEFVRDALERRSWGRFDVRIEGRSRWLAVVAFFMNWRSRLSGIATGDQAIFMRRDVFARVGGFADIPLMEDVALSVRLKAISRPACVAARVVTSGRRWERHGVLRTVVLMWRLRLAYFFGARPEDLARRYANGA